MAKDESERSVLGQPSVSYHTVAGNVLQRGGLVLQRHPFIDVCRKESGGAVPAPVDFIDVEIFVVRIIGKVFHVSEIVERLSLRILPFGSVIYELHVDIVNRAFLRD